MSVSDVYDTLADRRFDFVPLWGVAVVLLYEMRRSVQWGATAPGVG